MYIKLFENYKNDTLYVFDFDDTLVKTPDFSKLVIEYLKENTLIKDTINKVCNSIGIIPTDLKWLDNRVYIDDPDNNIILNNNWVRKGKRVYLLEPSSFGLTDESMPKEKLELVDLYNSIENKCIITGRSIKVKDKLLNVIKLLDIEDPKYGLHCYPYANHYNVGEWKGHKIVELVKENGFTNVIFYDDNSKYIKKASKVVKSELPYLNYKTIKV